MTPNKLALLSVALVHACGDGVTEGPGVGRDAANSGALDACVAGECRVSADYRELGNPVGVANRIDAETYLVWHTNIDGQCGSPSVLFWADFMSGKGAFADGIEPGTYELSSADFDMQTCGACIKMVAGEG